MDIEKIKKLKFGSKVVWHSYGKDEEEGNIKRVLRVDLDDRSFPVTPSSVYGFSGVGNNTVLQSTPSRYKGSITLWSGHFANKMDLEDFKKYYRIVKI